MPANVGPSFVEVVEPVVLVVGKSVDSGTSFVPRQKHACVMTSSNCVEPWDLSSVSRRNEMSCGYHEGINDRQSGVRVEWSSVKDGGKCLLMLDDGFELNHRLLPMIEEMLALLKVEGLVAGR
jgi:hypothetical protein